MDNIINKLIITYENVLSDKLCDNIIYNFNNNTINNTINNIDNENSNLSFLYIDTNSNDNWKEIDLLISNIISEYTNQYRDYLYKFIQIFPYGSLYDKGYTICQYKKNTGFHNLKHNFSWNESNDSKGTTILSFMFFLNTIDQDGEIEFTYGTKINPKKGNLIIFPATWDTTYKENISTKYDKYIITGNLYYNY